MLAKGLGQDAIYFDYVTRVEEALGDADYLSKFDAGAAVCEPWQDYARAVEEPKGLRRGRRRFCAGALRQLVFRQRAGVRSNGRGAALPVTRPARSPPKWSMRSTRQWPVVKAFAAWDETYKHREPQ